MLKGQRNQQKISNGIELSMGPRGGLYYESNGRKVYVNQTGSPQYETRRAAQPTTGWAESAPKKGRERARLFSECDAQGRQCFLRPNKQTPGQSGFPICPACRDPNVPCSCEPDCKGITAAFVRARQWKYEQEAELARQLQDKHNCRTDRYIAATSQRNQEGGMSKLPGVLYKSKGRFSQSYCPQPPPCPPFQPLQYKMRKRDELCCRKRPTRRVGPQ
jgi:hypothetical protein